MRLQDFVEIGQARELSQLQARLATFTDQFDFRWVNAVVVVDDAPGQPIFRSVGTHPAHFTAQKDPKLALADPVVTRLRREGLPFVYDQQYYVDAGAAQLWEHAAPFGYRTGISVALRVNQRQQLLLGMDREDRLPCSDGQIARMLADLQMLAVHCAYAAAQVLFPQQEVVVPVDLLTQREREALKWTAAGLKAYAVADKLNISERTVGMHLQNAMRKLGCANKHLAAAKATRLGLI